MGKLLPRVKFDLDLGRAGGFLCIYTYTLYIYICY